MLARGPALPLTLLPLEACAHKNDHARTKSAPPTDLKSRGKKAKHTVQSDVVFDSESNGRNFSSLAPPGGEKKIIFNFFSK